MSALANVGIAAGVSATMTLLAIAEVLTRTRRATRKQRATIITTLTAAGVAGTATALLVAL